MTDETKPIANGICKNCGASKDLHHFETNQCPSGGVEITFAEIQMGYMQEWGRETFEDTRIELYKSIIDRYNKNPSNSQFYVMVLKMLDAGYSFENIIRELITKGDDLFEKFKYLVQWSTPEIMDKINQKLDKQN